MVRREQCTAEWNLGNVIGRTRRPVVGQLREGPPPTRDALWGIPTILVARPFWGCRRLGHPRISNLSYMASLGFEPVGYAWTQGSERRYVFRTPIGLVVYRGVVLASLPGLLGLNPNAGLWRRWFPKQAAESIPQLLQDSAFMNAFAEGWLNCRPTSRPTLL